MSFQVPQGFRVAGVHCGIKRNPQKQDLTLVVADQPAVAAGVYTKNLVCAAPVVLDRSRTPSSNIRAIVCNSGNANACTGERGDRDARQMAAWAAKAADADETQVLVLSTGIIGEHLPMEKIEQGIESGGKQLANDGDALLSAARGMMTTDKVHKLAGCTIEHQGETLHITGLAKGSGMIGPNMATMLSIVLTDAQLTETDAQQVLSRAVDKTFNCISVDGHMSTNDTVLLLASGASGNGPLAGPSLDNFGKALRDVCEELAKAIVQDGEGASHLITIDVEGCASDADAHRIAKTVAESPLVKTAVAGADPNWGRIVSAAGYSGIDFDPAGVSLQINGFNLYENGSPIAFDASDVSQSIRENHDTSIVLGFREGAATARFWTCDLTTEYIRINTDYHT